MLAMSIASSHGRREKAWLTCLTPKPFSWLLRALSAADRAERWVERMKSGKRE